MKDDKRLWTRRELFGDVLLPASAALVLGTGLTGCSRSQSGYSTDKRIKDTGQLDMAIVKNGEPEELVRRCIGNLGGMQRFVSRGDVVLIKPNIGFNRVPEQAANTNPDVIRALCKMVLDAGARKVVIFDHTLYEPRNCYNRSGIAAAVKDLDVDLQFVEERKFVDVKVGGESLKNWPFYRSALEVDKIINVPVAKQHSLAKLSMGMKNLMGVIGGKRDSLHQGIDVALADISAYLRPTLTVLDAYRILMRNGPQGGSLSDARETRVLAAGIDPVAVDAFGCSLFDIDPRRIGYIREGEKRNLGRLNWDSLRVKVETI